MPSSDAAPALVEAPGALVLPGPGGRNGRGAWRIEGGVFDAAGAEIRLARHRFERADFAPPATMRRDDIAVQPGRWLFGGWLQPNFNHYLVFSLGQLWPLAAPAEAFDGVVFLSLDGRADILDQEPTLRALLAGLGLGPRLPVLVPAAPMRFATLVVGEPIHLGIPGAPRAHDAAFMALARGMARATPVRDTPGLYVSRSRLANKGGFVLESLIEDNLAAEGYAVIHPETLPIPDQLAAYAGARRVIFAEGSALHLAIGALDPATPVGVIARRRPVMPAMAHYLRGAGLRRAVTVDAIRSVVTFGGGDLAVGGARARGMAVLDFAALRDGLVAAGLCTGDAWRLPSPEEVAAAVARTIAERQKAWRRRVVTEVPIERLDPRQAGARPG